MPRSADPSITKLIEAVQAEECLWNTKSKVYKNKIKRKDAWNKLAEHLQLESGDKAQKQWFNLRTTYGKILANVRSINRSGSEANDGDWEESDWPYYELMDFVKDYVIPRTSKNNVNDENEDSEFTTKNEVRPTKKRKLGKDDVIRSASNTLDFVRETASSMLNKKDNFDVFGLYIASELRSLPPHIAQITKSRFHVFLNQAYQESSAFQHSTCAAGQFNPVHLQAQGQGFVIQSMSTNQQAPVVLPGMMNSPAVQVPHSYSRTMQVSTPVSNPMPNPQTVPNPGSFLRRLENITDDDEC